MQDKKQIAQILKNHRAKIDELDSQLINLLKERYDVIKQVAVIKKDKDIDAVLQDRVDEVRENAAKMAAEKGMDADFIRTLWAQLIEHSCNLEDDIKAAE